MRRPGDCSRRGAEPASDARDAEIGELGFAVLGDEDVAGLHVAVQDVVAVCGFESTRDLDSDADGLRPLQWAVPADARFERVVRVVVHHQVRQPGVAGAGLQDGDDVRVTREPSHRSLLAQEPVEVVGVEGGAENLHRNGPIERLLTAPVDDPETAAADLLRVGESGSGQCPNGIGLVSGEDRCGSGGERVVVGHLHASFRCFSRIVPLGARPAPIDSPVSITFVRPGCTGEPDDPDEKDTATRSGTHT